DDDILVRQFESDAFWSFDNCCFVGVLNFNDLALDNFRLAQVAAQVNECVTALDGTTNNFGKEGLIGQVGVWIDHGDDAAAIANLLLEAFSDVVTAVTTANNEDAGFWRSEEHT